ncbi:hypothetical protein BDR04DRAFT_1171787 [Suillus decipiens]|nr:hypothetical protein BDR04DRAFT_1171787 [Suillus decipiens]
MAAKSEAKHLQEHNEILTKCNRALGMHVSHAPLQKARAIKKATAHTAAQATKNTTFTLKNKNIITDTVCDTICKLVATHDIPVSSVQGVFGVVADCLGIAIEGDVSTRSIGRVLQEAEVAADVQMVMQYLGQFNLLKYQGFALSSDGTSHKNINYQSHHITYTSQDGKGVTRFVGIQHKVNHTSETQLQGWKDVLHDMCNTYNTCMAGEKAEVDPREVVTKVQGMLTDHAEDQKKLVRLFSDWKQTCEREVHALLWQMTKGVITAAGGMEAWEALTSREQHLRSSEALLQLKLTIGQEKFDGLTESAKESVDFFVWAGCCMHKDLNAVKGGNARMQSWWAHHSVNGPILLMNHDNTAAVLGGSSSVQARALHVSQRGAAKVLALVGAVFRHKDDKKGQQDSIWFFLEAHLGYFSPWPDTSNTHYHSNCDGACEWLVHQDLYIIYLGIVMDKKEARTHTNIEQNVFAAFHCNKTKQELVCFGAWGQCISHPYFRSVRNSSDNILDLGPLHNRLIAHIRTLIDNIELVFGALETLLRFCREFAPDGTIAQLSPGKRKLARMNSTNDANEGALGTLRVSMRHAPRMSLAHFNAHLKYKKNQTGTYMKTSLGPTAQRYLRKKACINDTAGMERKRRIAQSSGTARDQKKKEHREAAAAKLAAVVPRLTQEDIKKMRVAELDLQIRWHRQFDPQVPAAKDLKGKKAPEKRAILAAAAERLSSREVGPNTNESATMQEIKGNDTNLNVGAHLGDSDEEGDL